MEMKKQITRQRRWDEMACLINWENLLPKSAFMILSPRPLFLHQLNISTCVGVLRQQRRGSNAGQRHKPRDSWTTSEAKKSLKSSHFKVQFKNSGQESNHYRQTALSPQELYKLYLHVISWKSILKKGRGRKGKDSCPAAVTSKKKGLMSM